MWEHLLRPRGVREPPETIRAAVAAYLAARGGREGELGVEVPARLGQVVRERLFRPGVG